MTKAKDKMAGEGVKDEILRSAQNDSGETAQDDSEETRSDGGDSSASPQNDNESAQNGSGETRSDGGGEGDSSASPQNDKGDKEEEGGDVRYLRLAADFQNYKKRTEKERFERYSEGQKDFAADILPALDNFDRALAQDAARATDEQDKAFVSGMEMIFKQFIEALEKNGVTEIPALGEDFDPNVHHAVVMEPSEKYESQKVSEVLLKGYRIGEKVIRPTMVKVAE